MEVWTDGIMASQMDSRVSHCDWFKSNSVEKGASGASRGTEALAADILRPRLTLLRGEAKNVDASKETQLKANEIEARPLGL